MDVLDVTLPGLKTCVQRHVHVSQHTFQLMKQRKEYPGALFVWSTEKQLQENVQNRLNRVLGRAGLKLPFKVQTHDFRSS